MVFTSSCQVVIVWYVSTAVPLRRFSSEVLEFNTHYFKIILCVVDTLFNPLKPELNPICCLLALLGAHHFHHVSRIRVKLLTLRRLMSYIYIYIYIYIWSTHS